MNDIVLWLAAAAAAAGAVMFWTGVAGLLLRVSGWREMERMFPLAGRETADGRIFRFASGSAGLDGLPVRFGRCLRVTVAEDGLGMELGFPFGLSGRAFFIPGKAMADVRVEKSLFHTGTKFRPEGTGVTVCLWGDAGRAVAEKFGAEGS